VFGDIFPGTLAITALLAGLINAKNTGEANSLILQCLIQQCYFCERILFQYSYTGVSPKPIGNNHPLYHPYSLYHTSDGAIVLASFPERYWERFVEAANIPGLKEDSRFTDKDKRVAHREELDKIIENWTTKYTKQEVVERLKKNGCLVAQVNTAEDLFHSDHVLDREMLVEVEADPTTKKKVKIAGTPYKFSKTKPKVYNRAPLLGEHTVEIFKTA
jgi:formyl-CoA transferase